MQRRYRFVENNNVQKFINPYNFIPLSRDGKKYYDGDRNEEYFTGKMIVEIETKSPLFIPETIRKDEEDKDKHESLDFFQYGGNPVIPGSELRGMLRNVYETLTSSCMSAIDDDVEIVKRTNESYLPGLIKNENGQLSLHEATREREGKNTKGNEGQKIKDGYLLKGEKGFNKKSFARMVLVEGGEKFELDSTHISMLKKILRSYQNEKTNKHLTNGHYGYKEYGKALGEFLEGKSKEKYFPVYYSKVNDFIYLSPACITKETYKNKISMILKEQGNYNACVGVKLCPACSLFGMVGDKSAKASLVRFSDAKLEPGQKNVFLEKITLEELAQPKVSAAEFYLEKPEDAKFWTYDYYVDSDGNIQQYMPKIRGRKYYWHNLGRKLPKEVNETKRNKTVHALREKVRFTSEIYFDNITEMQLQQVIAICNVSGEYNDKAGYKIGAAKPLGFGSISMKIKEVKVREISLDADCVRYEEKQRDFSDIQLRNVFKDFTDEKVLTAFERMTHFDGAGSDGIITYPVTAEQYQNIRNGSEHTEGFQWFSFNHGRLAVRKKSKYEEVLPIVTKDKSVALQVKGRTAKANNDKKIFQNTTETYKIKIASDGIIDKNNPKFVLYDVEILDGKPIQEKGVLSVGKWEKLKKNQVVKAEYMKKFKTFRLRKD